MLIKLYFNYIYNKGDEKYIDYVNVIRKILRSIELSGSFELMIIIIGVFSRETNHICSEEIQYSLVQCTKRLDVSKQTEIITLYWENYFRKMENSDNQKKNIIFKSVLLNFLKNCEKSVFVAFMSSNIIYLIKLLDMDLRVRFNLRFLSRLLILTVGIFFKLKYI